MNIYKVILENGEEKYVVTVLKNKRLLEEELSGREFKVKSIEFISDAYMIEKTFFV